MKQTAFALQEPAADSYWGFGVRREDMKKMLIATRGKVFTVDTLPQMVEHTRLKDFASKQGS
jgi:hypothetical protein